MKRGQIMRRGICAGCRRNVAVCLDGSPWWHGNGAVQPCPGIDAPTIPLPLAAPLMAEADRREIDADMADALAALDKATGLLARIAARFRARPRIAREA